jgi:hypothetical protein
LQQRIAQSRPVSIVPRAINRNNTKINKGRTTNLVVAGPGQLLWRNGSPLPVSSNPQLGVNFVLGYQFALHDVAVQEVVVHCLCDDFGNCLGVELDESVVFLFSSLESRIMRMDRERERKTGTPSCSWTNEDG